RDVTARMQTEDELRDRAGRDQLTGLYGRQRFTEELERRFAEARRFGDPLALVVCDLDDLQEINTSHGLDVGDRALRALAATASATVRAIDVVGRVGTDEFAILLPRSGGDAAMRVVGAIEREMRDAEINAPGGPVALSVSCGLAVAGDGVADAGELLQAAEQMLSKHRPGR
ncbi:MAG TPA: GGDEF domain-containing protein, partial [Solirubrobacteraceae bacterium]